MMGCVSGARERREAARHLAELRRRLAAAEDALAAARKQAKAAFEAASDRFAAAQQALDAARDERARAGRSGMRPPGSPTGGGDHPAAAAPRGRAVRAAGPDGIIPAPAP